MSDDPPDDTVELLGGPADGRLVQFLFAPYTLALGYPDASGDMELHWYEPDGGYLGVHDQCGHAWEDDYADHVCQLWDGHDEEHWCPCEWEQALMEDDD